ncbi:hypothetical protein [Jiangella asiatica]|uniref:DUF3558 domain-containing protein n=1 Tax=Jiangella asiatica TaxID=2530372 RepID=A0A4R5CP15_9ACTN|nr:hypothetical protein [Jiangella asiatica]TDE00134.1 hypothetical protein E1269_26295 [Jiangella asiatica]
MSAAFTRSRSAAVAVAVVALGVVLAGCGGDDGQPAAATGNPSATEPAEAPVSPTPAATTTAAPATPPATDAAAPAEPAAPAGEEQPAAEGEPPAAEPETPAPDVPPAEPPAEPDDPAPDPPASAADVCTLGAEAITGLLGAGAAPMPEEADPNVCFWSSPAGQELVVSVSPYDDWVPADAVPGTRPQAVPDLGDEAWASLGAPSNLQVAWRRATISASVSASLPSGGSELPDVARAVDAALRAAGS